MFRNKHDLWLRALILLGVLFLLTAFSACGKGGKQQDKFSFYESVVDSSKPIAWGEDNDIYVFCDEPAWKLGKNMLINSLER